MHNLWVNSNGTFQVSLFIVSFNLYFMSKKLLLSEDEWARLEAVTPEEKEKALKKLARWIT